MSSSKPPFHDLVLWFLFGAVMLSRACIADQHDNVTCHEKEFFEATLHVDASSSRLIPKDFFGIFFEVSCWIHICNTTTTTTTSPSVISFSRDLGRSECRQPYTCKYRYSQRGRFQKTHNFFWENHFVVEKTFCILYMDKSNLKVETPTAHIVRT